MSMPRWSLPSGKPSVPIPPRATAVPEKNEFKVGPANPKALPTAQNATRSASPAMATPATDDLDDDDHANESLDEHEFFQPIVIPMSPMVQFMPQAFSQAASPSPAEVASPPASPADVASLPESPAEIPSRHVSPVELAPLPAVSPPEVISLLSDDEDDNDNTEGYREGDKDNNDTLKEPPSAAAAENSSTPPAISPTRPSDNKTQSEPPLGSTSSGPAENSSTASPVSSTHPSEHNPQPGSMAWIADMSQWMDELLARIESTGTASTQHQVSEKSSESEATTDSHAASSYPTSALATSSSSSAASSSSSASSSLDMHPSHSTPDNAYPELPSSFDFSDMYPAPPTSSPQTSSSPAPSLSWGSNVTASSATSSSSNAQSAWTPAPALPHPDSNFDLGIDWGLDSNLDWQSLGLGFSSALPGSDAPSTSGSSNTTSSLQSALSNPAPSAWSPPSASAPFSSANNFSDNNPYANLNPWSHAEPIFHSQYAKNQASTSSGKASQHAPNQAFTSASTSTANVYQAPPASSSASSAPSSLTRTLWDARRNHYRNAGAVQGTSARPVPIPSSSTRPVPIPGSSARPIQNTNTRPSPIPTPKSNTSQTENNGWHNLNVRYNPSASMLPSMSTPDVDPIAYVLPPDANINANANGNTSNAFVPLNGCIDPRMLVIKPNPVVDLPHKEITLNHIESSLPDSGRESRLDVRVRAEHAAMPTSSGESPGHAVAVPTADSTGETTAPGKRKRATRFSDYTESVPVTEGDASGRQTKKRRSAGKRKETAPTPAPAPAPDARTSRFVDPNDPAYSQDTSIPPDYILVWDTTGRKGAQRR